MSKKDQTKDESNVLNVQEVYARTEGFVEKNRKALFGVLGAVAVGFIGFFSYQYLYLHPKEVEASNAMWKAQQYMEIDSLDWAQNGHEEFEGLESIAQKYSGTKQGKLAHYYLGIIYRDKADYQTALDHFKEADFDDNAVGIIAMGNVGDMYIELGNNEEGAAWLEKAARRAASADSKYYLGPVYMLKASKAFMEIGNDDKAISLLTSVTEDFDKNTQEYQEASKLLAMLKAKKG